MAHTNLQNPQFSHQFHQFQNKKICFPFCNIIAINSKIIIDFKFSSWCKFDFILRLQYETIFETAFSSSRRVRWVFEPMNVDQFYSHQSIPHHPSLQGGLPTTPWVGGGVGLTFCTVCCVLFVVSRLSFLHIFISTVCTVLQHYICAFVGILQEPKEHTP